MAKKKPISRDYRLSGALGTVETGVATVIRVPNQVSLLSSVVISRRV
jgi:hypothetical protein